MKRAQVQAALLIALITTFMVLYILFLPPEERAEILEEGRKNITAEKEQTTVSKPKLLLDASPGTLVFLSDKRVEHFIPNFNLIAEAEGKILKKISSIGISKSLFSKKNRRILFDIDPQETKRILFSARVTKTSGRLIATLNGENIFNTKVEEGNVLIELPNEFLEKSNELELSVSSPGILFFLTNSYTLADAQVVADVSTKEALSSTQSFIVSDAELSGMEKAVLRFTPTCDPDAVGPLEITLNNNPVYNSVPDCDSINRAEISPTLFKEGSNTIKFSTVKGSYKPIELINVVSELKKIEYRTYFFTVSDELSNDVKNDKRKVNLSMTFTDDISLKEGILIINGKVEDFSQKDSDFNLDISERVEKGTNSVQIVPSKTFSVRKLQVKSE